MIKKIIYWFRCKCFECGSDKTDWRGSPVCIEGCDFHVPEKDDTKTVKIYPAKDGKGYMKITENIIELPPEPKTLPEAIKQIEDMWEFEMDKTIMNVQIEQLKKNWKMDVTELETLLKELRNRENYLVKLQDTETKDIDVGYWGSFNRLTIFTLNVEERESLKQCCLKRISEIKILIEPVLTR